VSANAPRSVRDLAERRQAARTARDFARADRLRDDIAAAGWKVVDGPEGFDLESLAEALELYPTVASVPSRAGEPDRCRHSLCVAVHGWPADVRRLLAACLSPATEVVAVDAAGAGLAPSDIVPEDGAGAGVTVVRVEEAIGHADAWNVAARRARGRILVFVEPSLEFGADVLETLAAALDDGEVGLVGPFGLSTDNTRDFEVAAGPDVDALEYLLGMRREDVGRAGEMDRRFRFYRNLDIDFSYQVRAAGLAVRWVDSGDIARHTHRVWESTPEDERERLSRKNFNRFLDRWGRS
jgi:GT2 family glycosyltransferase